MGFVGSESIFGWVHSKYVFNLLCFINRIYFLLLGFYIWFRCFCFCKQFKVSSTVFSKFELFQKSDFKKSDLYILKSICICCFKYVFSKSDLYMTFQKSDFRIPVSLISNMFVFNICCINKFSKPSCFLMWCEAGTIFLAAVKRSFLIRFSTSRGGKILIIVK